jgi:hypothetical protein
MKRWFIIVGVIINLVGVSTLTAQLNLNNISANIGVINTLYSDLVIYPEVQIGGNVIIPSIRWTIYWGYWIEGINKPIIGSDYVTYSYNSHILGTRFTLMLSKLSDNLDLPFGIFIGASHHFISVKYIGGAGIDGKPGHDATIGTTTLEVGLNAEVQAFGPVYFRGEIQQFIPIGNDYYDRLQKNRRTYKIGLAYIL